MRRQPHVSIIIPIYNGERFLAECLESVLNQTFSDFELILIDDGSEDSSYDIAAGYAAYDDRVILLSHGRNLGAAAALNRGLQCASGRLIARLDQDDLALPHRLKEQTAFLEKHQDVVLLGSMVTLISAAGEIMKDQWWFPETDCQIRFGLLFNNKIADPSIVCRAEVIGENRLRFDPLYLGAEDYLFWVNVLKYGRAYSIPEPLTKYRIHESQMSRQYAFQQEQAAERISFKLIDEFDSSLKPSSIERHVLDIMYLTFLKDYYSDPQSVPAESFQRLWGRTQPEGEFRQALEKLTVRKTLQNMVGKFISRRQSGDAALICLQNI